MDVEMVESEKPKNSASSEQDSVNLFDVNAVESTQEASESLLAGYEPNLENLVPEAKEAGSENTETESSEQNTENLVPENETDDNSENLVTETDMDLNSENLVTESEDVNKATSVIVKNASVFGPRLSQLPLARIKHIMKMDTDVHMASQDAVFMVAKALELFIESLAVESFSYTSSSKKKTVSKDDVFKAIDAVDALAFLDGALED